MKSKLIRVNIELAKEIEELARKNQIKITEASREVAQLIKNGRYKKQKLVREIKF